MRFHNIFSTCLILFNRICHIYAYVINLNIRINFYPYQAFTTYSEIFSFPLGFKYLPAKNGVLNTANIYSTSKEEYIISNDFFENGSDFSYFESNIQFTAILTE